ncbi:MAG: TfoX/Sxy family protein [Stellaceae bacterium]
MANRRARGKAGSGETIEHIVDLLRGWSQVDAKRMFSGHGLFRAGLMFGIVIRDVPYFKTDDGNRGDYEAGGMTPFRYQRGAKRVALGYHAVPAEALDDSDMLAAWAEKAYAAAVRKAARRPKRATAINKRVPRGRHR